ncbi:MAG: GPW/gp25 family protein [Phaeodactylibacter sp.]|nr:GPW/gp25 family protein [Phaeodactylibacter sp.]MCB9274938.1 GPW/gp25 family protein [Lewinellaceae bacterium]
MAKDDNFLGRGWSFPTAFDKKTQSVSMLSGEEDIRSSLEILLSTRVGERVMQPAYGTNLDQFVFEALSTSFVTYMRDWIKKAIDFYEPRIDLKKADVVTDRSNEGILFIVLDYVVRSTNTRNNLVYPFYLNEGTET